MRRYLLLSLLLILPASLLCAGAQAEKWDYWDSFVEDSQLEVEHALWQEFLDEYLYTESPDGIHRFDYASASGAGERLLDDYISGMESVEIRKYRAEQQFAYWVNLYNSVTIRLILDNYPVKSIRKISDPWGRKLVTVEGEALSLNDIEHRILRPIWRDPRIHFVVNCASLGCPNLPSTALTAVNHEEVLESSALEFISHRRGAVIEDDRLILSSIFDWYSEDFGSNEAEVLGYINRYRSRQLPDGLRVKYDYDWDLNNLSK